MSAWQVPMDGKFLPLTKSSLSTRFYDRRSRELVVVGYWYGKTEANYRGGD